MYRKFNIVPQVYLDGKGELKTRYIFNAREEVIPAQARIQSPCLVCREPMTQAAGQIAFYHARCRADRSDQVIHTQIVDK